jgi:hypothetical protein
MHALERVSGCPRIVRVLSTNSRTGRPPCLGVDRARVLDVRIFVKISEPGDPDPISFLTKILTSKTRARAPVRTEGALSAACPRHVHKLADWAPPFSGGGECSRFGCKDFRQNLKAMRSRSYLILTKILTSKTRARAPVRTEGALSAACPRHVHKLADWAPPAWPGGARSRFGCKDFRQNLRAGRSRSYLIFDENPYIQNASAVACPEEGVPCPQSCGHAADKPLTIS